MALLVYPSLRGLTWPLKRTTVAGSNLVFTAASGALAVAQLWSAPIYEWELDYDGLASNAGYPGLGTQSKQLLESFFLSVGGRGTPFLYIDNTDTTETGSALGIGDGTTVTFTAKRTLGTYAETVDAILNVGAVYLNGVVQASSGWSVSAPNGIDANAITFATAPASGAVITIDFWYAFKVRFMSDNLEFTQFMSGLWQASGFKFRRERV